MWRFCRSFSFHIPPLFSTKFMNPTPARDISMSTVLKSLLLNSKPNLLVPVSKLLGGGIDDIPANNLPTGVFVPFRGMKVKGRVKKRCKDCYLIWQEGILHVECKTHGRHKQKQKPKYWANLRILTDASQTPKRAW